MEGIYLLYIIPFVFIQTVYGEGIEFPFNEVPGEQERDTMITVTCTLSKDTPNRELATFTWFNKDGEPIVNTNSEISPYVRSNPNCGGYGFCYLLKIEGVTDDDSGNYKCSAQVNDVPYEKDYPLTVIAPLEFKNCESEQFGVLGKKSEIHCSASAGSQPTLGWEKAGEQLTSDGAYQITDVKLTIINTTAADEGKYKVIASTSMIGNSASISKSIDFKVHTAPTIIAPILQNIAIVGRKAQLFCKAKGKPRPTIEWRKEGSTNVLTTTDRINVTMKEEGTETVQGSLEFMSVIKEDEAVYSCTAKNLASERDPADAAETSNKLVVQTPPEIKDTNDAMGTEGGATNLVCKAYGDPLPEIVWKNVLTQKMYAAGYSEDGISVSSKQIGNEANPGSSLDLAFTSLKHEDAGEYECEAKNLADVATHVVNLEVRYRPNFNEQKETIFYTWAGNDNEQITCTATANPEPIFEWFKNTGTDFIQIKNGDNFFSLTQPVVNTEKPHESTSSLYVAYNGQNDEAVFGAYTCLAKNTIGSSNITLEVKKAVEPKEPQVSVEKEDARHIEFKLKPGSSQGPQVTHFKVEYKVEGGTEPIKEQIVKIEERDHIDADRQYTYLPVQDLSANTRYVFTFYSKNVVGWSPGTPIRRTTPEISAPGIPLITSRANAPGSTQLLVQWDRPNDGGDLILIYLVQYRQVTVREVVSTPGQEYELDSPKDEFRKQETPNTQLLLKNLIPGTYIQVEVRAKNGKGESSPGMKIFKMKEDPRYNPATGGAPRIAPVTTPAIILSCIAALSACLMFSV